MDQRKVIGKRPLGGGKWIKLVELEYSSGKNILNWEMVERTTKTEHGLDGNVNL